MRTLLSLAAISVTAVLLLAQQQQQQQKKGPQPPYKPTPAEMQQLQSKASELDGLLKKVEKNPLYADAAIYRKSAEFIVRLPEEFLDRSFFTNTLAQLDEGIARAKELGAGTSSWAKSKGRLVRAYVSDVDGSVQPYGMIIPDSYNGQPTRLDIWMHGTNRSLNEVLFVNQHEGNQPVPADQNYIQVDAYGRSNNSYRWAGETDLFETLKSVQKQYNIDPRRITIRGFSMGGASAWHLGVHHPDQFAAFEAGAGYVETKIYAKKGPLPPWEDTALHYYDAQDVALNAVNIPFVGYGGEIDAQLKASQTMKAQLVREGIDLASIRAIFLVGPQTGHAWHPDSKKISNHFVDEAVMKGLAPPPRIRLVTYTTRFNKCFWITVEALEKTYERGEIDSSRNGNRTTVATKNVARIQVDGNGPVTLDGQEFPAAGVFAKNNGKWAKAGAVQGLLKRHALQGPIDDAFVESFLCVRPTSTGTKATEYGMQELDTLQKAFVKWLRGDPRVKDDKAVTASDIANNNLILFGDPWSNSVIAKVIGKLPIQWTKEKITIAGRTYDATTNAPALIYPNPLNPNKYVVINSGHTFSDSDWSGTNANLYPHLGDYGIIALNNRETVYSGYFDEHWK